jgi:hypothetical protein
MNIHSLGNHRHAHQGQKSSLDHHLCWLSADQRFRIEISSSTGVVVRGRMTRNRQEKMYETVPDQYVKVRQKERDPKKGLFTK